MGLLDNILSAVDNRKRVIKRGLLDFVNDPKGTAQMVGDRMREDMYGGAEEKQAVQNSLRGKPYDKAALARADANQQKNMLDQTIGAMTVYHGSPHKFDKFDMSKIGSGEGSQAYGHGLYFAEDQSVANSYKAMANKPGRRQAGLTSDGREQSVLDALIKMNARQFTGGDVNQLSELIARRPGAFDKPDKLISRIAEYEGNLAPSYMYKVDIPDDSIGKFLDIESNIPEEVRTQLSSALMNKFGSGVSLGSGEQAYKQVLDEFKASGDANYKNSAVKWLSENGIPGLKFKDAGSRVGSDGTSNFVLFDDQMPRILEVNGQATGLQPWKQGEYGLLK